MSMLETCATCDALLRGFGGETQCERCAKPCGECGRDVAYCLHPLAERELRTGIERDLRFTMEQQKDAA